MLQSPSRARLVATFDLGKALTQYGAIRMNNPAWTLWETGGELTLLEGEVKIAFIPAVHSSTVTKPQDTQDIRDGGSRWFPHHH